MKVALFCVTGIFLAMASVAVAQTAPWAMDGVEGRGDGETRCNRPAPPAGASTVG